MIRRMLKKRPRPVRAALQEVLRLFDRGGKFVCPMRGRDTRRRQPFPESCRMPACAVGFWHRFVRV